ncbi:uncharacterized protein LOC132044122 [Lycium ferocissimum]|uniref:uncharacterized protein LOC132044122 n=1 Tax=Lycium ferocissimum TaxID=112874 RepID=UPI0028157044|nr:uncharacterized protein LOC132044122 [Lycium ferocissimum]
MCPLRFILVFFSALLAGYVAWSTLGSSSPDIDCTKTEKEKQEFDSPKVRKFQMIQDGFWVFVDMASGKYLWRNLKVIKSC